jgi:Pectinacetylesterase
VTATSSRDRARTSRRPITVALAMLALAGLLVACSGGGSDGASASANHDLSAEEEAQLETETEFAQCLREQGLEGYPDPRVSQSGYLLTGVPFGAGEEWQAAQEACVHVVDEAVAPDDTDADAAAWERVVPGGDCQCSDGSEFNFWVREANPNRVVLFLQGGGGCFSAETCAPDSDLYLTSITEAPEWEGVFDFEDERNPFADHSVVYVPYCTGDVHIGNATTKYAPGLTIQHKGYLNSTAALDHLAATFPGATDVVVMGESAGSMASPLYAGLVADHLPDARITVLADGSGAYPEVPDIMGRVGDVWGTENAIPDWPENTGLTAEQWSLPGLFIQSGRHDPEIVFARHDYAYDENQEYRLPLAGIPVRDLLLLIDANESHIEGAGVNLRSYIAPGDEHTVLTDVRFYTEEVNGQSLVNWVTRLIAGEPVEDVHCTNCCRPTTRRPRGC